MGTVQSTVGSDSGHLALLWQCCSKQTKNAPWISCWICNVQTSSKCNICQNMYLYVIFHQLC